MDQNLVEKIKNSGMWSDVTVNEFGQAASNFMVSSLQNHAPVSPTAKLGILDLTLGMDLIILWNLKVLFETAILRSTYS